MRHLKAIESIDGQTALFIKDNKVVGKGRVCSGLGTLRCSVQVRDDPAAIEFFKDDELVKYWREAGFPIKFAFFRFYTLDGSPFQDERDSPDRLKGIRIVDEYNFEMGFVDPEIFGMIEGYGKLMKERTQ
jgi:hypothetical protein